MTIFEKIRKMAEKNAPNENEKERIRNCEVSASSLKTMVDYIKGFYVTHHCVIENRKPAPNENYTIGVWDNLIDFINSEPSIDLLNRKIHTELYATEDDEDDPYWGYDSEYEGCFCWQLA